MPAIWLLVLAGCEIGAPLGDLAPAIRPGGTVTVHFDLTAAPAPLHRVRLEVYQPGGEPIVREGTKPGLLSLFWIHLSPGRWFLRAQALTAADEVLLCGTTWVDVEAGRVTQAQLDLTTEALCTPAELDCADGLDDDGDGTTDCGDDDCQGVLCDDGEACTILEICSAGSCAPGEPMPCDDGNVCTTDTCTDGACAHQAMPGCCTNGAACADGDPCTLDVCEPDQTCSHAPVPECCAADADCGAAEACTTVACGPDHTCVVTPIDGCCTADQQCLDGEPCTEDRCVASSCEHTPTPGACDDGDLCTMGDTCAGGTCSGVPMECDDGDPCTSDTCVPDSGCATAPLVGCCTTADDCATEGACQTAACLDGTCVLSPIDGCCTDASDCSEDGLACTLETCVDHSCSQVPSDAACDDEDPCTDDTCQPTGCDHVVIDGCCQEDAGCPSDGPCRAGRCADGLCTLATVPGCCVTEAECAAGSCESAACVDNSCIVSPVPGCCVTAADCADDGIACTTPVCESDTCGQVPEDAGCDDLNPCTSDACEPSSGCAHEALPGECDDGDPCTIGDGCVAGQCAPGGDACDDDNPCTVDSCQADGSCAHTDAVGPCDDGDACTTADVCASGRCIGPLPACDDGDPCTSDHCDAGECDQAFGTAPCEDGDACTTGDACDGAGACTPGQELDCDDGDSCTEDVCHPLVGCRHDTALGDACSTDADCVSPDACQVAICLLGRCEHVTLPCGDPDACEIWTPCTPTGGAPECTVIGAVDCDDGDPCTADACDPGSGCVHVDACGCMADSDCDDGDACTDDRCLGGACAHGPYRETCGNGADDDCDGLTDQRCVWLVDAASTSPAPDGHGWETAWPTIDEATAAASAGDEVWVRAGTYRAGEPSAAVLTMKAEVGVYGGFAGGETSLMRRPEPPLETVLDGDRDQSQTATVGDSRHVVIGASEAILDSFVVRGGHATGVGDERRGAGLFAKEVYGLTVRRCHFTENRAEEHGGALYDWTETTGSSGVRLTECRFDNNVSGVGGGAIALRGSGTWDLSDLELIDNQAVYGGGIHLLGTGGSVSVENAVIRGNEANGGGGIDVEGPMTLSVLGATFEANRALTFHGGGGLRVTEADVTLVAVRLSGNHSEGHGGGIDAVESSLTLSMVEIRDCAAVSEGGALSATDSLVTVTGGLYSGNVSSDDGGAVHSWQGALSMTGAELRCNTAAKNGGGIYQGGGSLTLSDVRFESNHSSGVGGGVHAVSTTALIQGTRFQTNRANSGGGLNVSNPPVGAFFVRDSHFEGNVASGNGGGIRSSGGSPLFANSTFRANLATNGGALAAIGTPVVSGCSMTENVATDSGGGVFSQHDEALKIVNTALFGNQANQGHPELAPLGTMLVSHSCIRSWADGGIGNLSLSESPFVTGPAGQLFLRHAGLDGATTTTLCVDAGDPAAAEWAEIPFSLLSTRSDGGLDTGQVDIGRHHPVD